MRSISTAAVFAWVAAVGCSDTTAARHGALRVTVEAPTAVADRSATSDLLAGQVPLVVTLENPSSSTVRVYSCGPTIERDTPAGWTTAVEPFCDLSSSSTSVLELPPSAQRTLNAVIHSVGSGEGRTEIRDGMLVGRYRLMYRYAAVEDVGRMDEARSAPFGDAE
jgi:hypothetical protein